MNNWLRKLMGILIVLAVIALGYFGGWWDDILHPSQPVKQILKQELPPGITIRNTQLIGWDKQKKSWEIEAKRIWQSADGSIVHFENIQNGIVFSEKDRQIQFKAGWARWEKYNSQLYIGGGLEAEIDKGRFVTDEAVMNYQGQEMTCPKPIQYSEPNLSIVAKSMKVGLNNEELTLEGEVLLKQNKDEVRSNGIIYNQKEKKYHLIEPKGVTLDL